MSPERFEIRVHWHESVGTLARAATGMAAAAAAATTFTGSGRMHLQVTTLNETTRTTATNSAGGLDVISSFFLAN
jgi:hypothetical protein